MLPRQIQEDAVSFAVEEWLTGRSELTSFKHIVIDYLRKYEKGFGARRPEDALGRSSSLTMPDGHELDVEDFDATANYISDDYLEGLKPFERAIMKLFYEWQFSQAEIGELFGWTAENVGQYMSLSRKWMRHLIEKERAG